MSDTTDLKTKITNNRKTIAIAAGCLLTFILCLGYRGDLIREFFLNYQETLSNDFVLSEGGKRIELLKTDIQDWRITFVDTGRADCWTHREGETGRHGGTGSDDDADGKLIVPWTVALAIDECERAGLVSATHQAGDPVDRTT